MNTIAVAAALPPLRAADSPPGIVIAAPASGSGKTTVTLGLLRALARQGRRVVSAKVGPDFIDPRFHEAASGRPCLNLDAWAMRPGLLDRQVARIEAGADLVIAEGVMGLFDGAADGSGSTADLAARYGWPVVLIVDVRGQAQSAAATLAGFRDYRPDVAVRGVVFNRAGGPRHVAMLNQACRTAGVTVIGCLPWRSDLDLPSRHLGLVQAAEHDDLDCFIDRAAGHVAEHLDLAAVAALAGRRGPDLAVVEPLPPLGQRIAVADDPAFAFAYPWLLDGWRDQGAEIVPFSPLADQAPDAAADAVYLPGGYPELQVGRLAAGDHWQAGVRAAASRGAVVYGECGGYMVLGRGLVDADGIRHGLLGLLPVETSFAERRLHLGYRRARLRAAAPFGTAGSLWRGHEFHYASVVDEDRSNAPFDLTDSDGTALGPAGARAGSVFGSFLHLIDREP